MRRPFPVRGPARHRPVQQVQHDYVHRYYRFAPVGHQSVKIAVQMPPRESGLAGTTTGSCARLGAILPESGG